VRTLVVSDLHIGARDARARLEDPVALGALRAAAGRVDRLVLLGDVLELRQGPLQDALAAASRVLPGLAEALGPALEVVIVPGNHDHALLAGWVARRATAGSPPALGLAAEVDWRDGEPLGALAAALGTGGAAVSARYPGIWLRDDVYATHGHYLDRHTTVPTFERLGAGAAARILRRPLAETAAAEDYEAVLGPIYAWIYATAQSTSGETRDANSERVWEIIRDARGVRRLGWNAAVAGATAALNAAGLGPLSRDLSAVEFRRAGLLALGDVLESLAAACTYAIFGHTHRAGPLPGDDPAEWRARTGARLFNSGSWLQDPTFNDGSPDSPYRPGFAIELDERGPPRLVNLLD